MVKQREHDAFDKFAVIRKNLTARGRCVHRNQRAKLPKRAREATCVFAFFEIAARERISEKNPAFSADHDHNGTDTDPNHDV
jgi:hypothetical protein